MTSPLLLLLSLTAACGSPAAAQDPALAEARDRFRAGDLAAGQQLVSAGADGIPLLVEVLDDPEAGVSRFLAANLLGDLGLPECVPPLLDALGDPWFNVRRCAALALGKIGDPRAREPLESLAAKDPFLYRDPDTGEQRYLVREDAARALALLATPEETFLEDASVPPPPGIELPEGCAWPFAGGFRAQNLYNNYQQPTDHYVHAAMDLLQDAGTEVRAVASGTVALVATNYPDWDTHHFFIVEEEPGSGRGWCYTHVDPASYRFEVGDKVRKREVLGEVVAFSLGDRPGVDHLHLHYVAFERQADGKVEMHSLFDPLACFPFRDSRPPTVHGPLTFTRGGTLDAFVPEDEDEPVVVAGRVDVLAVITDDAYPGHVSNWGVPVITIEIEGEDVEPWRKLVLDQRGPIAEDRAVAPLYLANAAKRRFTAGMPPVPVPYVVKATHTDGDGVIESSDERFVRDTGGTDGDGERRFPDGLYRVTVRAWDLAGNLGERTTEVRVRNDTTRR